MRSSEYFVTAAPPSQIPSDDDGHHGPQSDGRSRRESLDTLTAMLAAELPLWRRLRRRVPRATASPSRRKTSRSGSSPLPCARADRDNDARRPGDRRPRRARRRRPHRRCEERARAVSRPPLGARLAAERRVARLLAAQARVPRRVARPPGEGRPARGHRGSTSRPTSATRSLRAAARCWSSLPVPSLDASSAIPGCLTCEA